MPVSYTHLDVYKRQGDALAIGQVGNALDLRHCYSDLFMVMKNMGWQKAVVYTTADVEELIAEMAAFIPASYDVSLSAGSNDAQEALVEGLRQDIQTRHAAQDVGGSAGDEPVLRMADLLPESSIARAAEEASTRPPVALATTHEQAEAHPSVQAAAQLPADLVGLMANLAKGQQILQEQFGGLMTILGGAAAAQRGVATGSLLPPAGPDDAAEVAAGVAPPAENAEPHTSDSGPDHRPVTTTLGDPDMDVGRIPDPPADIEDTQEVATVIGHIPANPDSDQSKSAAGIPQSATESQRTDTALSPAVPRERISADAVLAVAAQQSYDHALGPGDRLTDPQVQVIESLTGVMRTALTELFLMRNDMEEMRYGRIKRSA